MHRADFIWMDGELVAWDEARVHVLTHTLHYGLGVFEGIRCYRCDDGRSAVFRLQEHLIRLDQSARILALKSPYVVEQMVPACLETIRANRLSECYIRPLMFVGAGRVGLAATGNPLHFAIAVWPCGSY